MTFFESLLLLLLTAIVLLQIARRLGLPYPAMLALAGVGVAFIPGAPNIPIAPETALALFIAPAIVDAAYDFPPGAARRFWLPLVALAAVAVVITTAVVAAFGHVLLGLPIAAAMALGAIVSPPDAAAATAVLNSVSIPRSTDSVLKGESLFNDATALLLFSASLAVLQNGSLSPAIAVRLGLAVPGGILLGVAFAFTLSRINSLVKDTLGGNLLQFVSAFLMWIVADRLRLSAVLCTVASAMTLARSSEINGATRMRVHSYAVWSAVVFTLNVLAFLLMGMQVRTILERMNHGHLQEALRFAGLIVLTVVLVRLIVVISSNRTLAWWRRVHGQPEPASIRQALLTGWSGMRGFVTLATAFALPASFPQRDMVVLTAFAVVLGTLVLQGLTLAPLIRLLKLDQSETASQEMANAQASLSAVALDSLRHRRGPEAENLRFVYTLERDTAQRLHESRSFERRRRLGLEAIRAERVQLEKLRSEDQIGASVYLKLQEELDWRELTLLPSDQREIQES